MVYSHVDACVFPCLYVCNSTRVQRPTKDMNKWHKAMDKLQRTERSESPSEYDDEVLTGENVCALTH